MKKFILVILVTAFTTSALAENNAPSASESERYLSIINNPNQSLTQKSVARLFLDVATVKLEGQVEHTENLPDLKVNLENYFLNYADSMSFNSEKEDEEPTNIKDLLVWDCKADGKCSLKILRTNGIKKKYEFEVLLDEQQKPIAVKDNKVVVTVEQ